MIDSFDYKEPSCAVCGGKDFYNPKKDSPSGRIPISRIIDKVNSFFDKNDLEGAKELLEYWKNEAISLKDINGELAVESELIGLYRKMLIKEKGLCSIENALSLLEKLQLSKTLSGATILLNCATTLKAFGNPERAISIYENVLPIYKEKLKEDDERLAGLYNNMALTLSDLERYDEATASFIKAITTLELSNKFNPDIAVSYVNLAHTYYDMGKEKENITDCLFKAYEILVADETIKNGYYAYVLTKCSPSFEFFGYDKISQDFNKTAGEIYERN